MTGLDRLVVIGGPTGTGKSDLAMDVAQRLDGEIVNADSMQLYRDMDIGTAKLAPADRRGIPHHLLDVLDISERASVATYQQHARATIADILRRGRTPVLVGGSGLYIAAVVDPIEFPGTDPAVRAALEMELAAVGPAVLYERLRTLDPIAADRVEPANGRRLVRALEVITLTGGPFAATLPAHGPPMFDAVLVCLDRHTEDLDLRLAHRVRQMLATGFLDEVARLETRGLRTAVTASLALGYRQLLGVLDGTTDLATAESDTVRATRRFVRRQRSWFRRDQRMLRFDAAADDLVDRVVAGVSRTV